MNTIKMETSDFNSVIRIAITGPESTGKSSLCEALANHYNTLWVPEYAREYCEKLGRDYVEDDIAIIAKKQLEIEEEYASRANGFLFIDTDLNVPLIWGLHKYSRNDAWLEQIYKSHIYPLVLLTDIDLPWEFDPLREYPDQRNFFFTWFVKLLKQQNANYHVIGGEGDNRLFNAVQVIENWINESR